MATSDTLSHNDTVLLLLPNPVSKTTVNTKNILHSLKQTEPGPHLETTHSEATPTRRDFSMGIITEVVCFGERVSRAQGWREGYHLGYLEDDKQTKFGKTPH